MKLMSLTVTRENTYGSFDEAKPLTGKVQFAGLDGKIELVLSPGMISRLVQCLSTEASVSSKLIAKQIPRAVEDAIDGGLLLESDGRVGVE